MIDLSTLKAHFQVPVWNCRQQGHLFDIILPLKAKLDGDIPNLDGCGDQMDWGELTDPDPELEELLEKSELRLFFDD